MKNGGIITVNLTIPMICLSERGWFINITEMMIVNSFLVVVTMEQVRGENSLIVLKMKYCNQIYNKANILLAILQLHFTY